MTLNAHCPLRSGLTCRAGVGKTFDSGVTIDAPDINMNILVEFIQKLGPLRIALAVCAIIAIFFTPQPGAQVVLFGTGFITTLLIPVLTPMIFMGLLFDALMSRVKQIEADVEEKNRYKLIVIVNLALALTIFITWLPFITALRH
jgi:uncharacterized membrane protein